MKVWIKDRKNIAIAVLAVVSFLLVLLLLLKDPATLPVKQSEHVHHDAESAATVWTCSMHPQIRQSGPGQCPLCGMDLIPVNESNDLEGPWALKLSDHARKLADIQTVAVERRHVAHEIRMVGKVDFDEKRISDITARAPGRIDRLYVDFTGIEVRKGDHLVELYSPELITAQQELRQALRSVNTGHESIQKANESRLRATRRKLDLLGLSQEQIQAIEEQENPSDHLTIESTMAGIVIKKHLNEGAYIKTGMPIYTIADLSRVWIVLDAYESDISWLRYGQEASFEVEAYPGEIFRGRIVFIDPSLNPRSRTIKVRLDMPNPNGRLKPDMFVRAIVHAMISPDGKTMDPSLAGKWISPMHPEIVKDKPGDCDVCGMALVKAESLGFVTADTSEKPLVIPASAALVTGERAVVYVATDEEGGVFEGREVVLGPETGKYYVVRSGLKEGDRVVVNGAFKIDSELQIRAKNSMMYHPTASEEMELAIVATTAAFRKTLQAVYAAYFQLQNQLSLDALHPAHQAGANLQAALATVAVDQLDAKDRVLWDRESQELGRRLERLAGVSELDQARARFEPISEKIYQIARQFGFADQAVVYRFHCPMAFDGKGADWLQNHGDTANPYYGSAMFSCGSRVEDVVATRAKAAASAPPKGGGHVH